MIVGGGVPQNPSFFGHRTNNQNQKKQTSRPQEKPLLKNKKSQTTSTQKVTRKSTNQLFDCLTDCFRFGCFDLELED